MKYVELNLFPEEEEETQKSSDSKWNNKYNSDKGKEYNSDKGNEYSSDESNKYDFTNLFERLSKSEFRSRFHLSQKDMEYIASKGLATIRKHAEDFVAKRLAPAIIPNDGKQTPMRGHPVFIAQHATGCCCRGCFSNGIIYQLEGCLQGKNSNMLLLYLWLGLKSTTREHVSFDNIDKQVQYIKTTNIIKQKL